MPNPVSELTTKAPILDGVSLLDPPSMLKIRNKVDAALQKEGWEFHGGGVSVVDATADLEMSLGDLDFIVNITQRVSKQKVNHNGKS